MRVYLLVTGTYESCSHCGIFSTIEKAKAAGLEYRHQGAWHLNSLGRWELDNVRNGANFSYDIEEVTVDATL